VRAANVKEVMSLVLLPPLYQSTQNQHKTSTREKAKDNTMADRSRSRSRSPEGGPPPADDPPHDENGDAPPKGDAHPKDAPAGDEGEEVKLYVGNLDYGTYSIST
jgi:hypothetical protein